MPKLITFVLVFFSVLCLSLPVIGEWGVYKRAQISNTEKNTLRFDRYMPGGSVRAWLILGKKQIGAFDTKLPIYQIDTNKIHDIVQFAGIRTNKEKDYWILWSISDVSKPDNEDLREFMNGKSVVFQYYLPDGEIREMKFDLKGAKKAIEEILE